MPAADQRDGKSELLLASGFYLEWEKWAKEKLVDGLLCAAPHKTGVQLERHIAFTLKRYLEVRVVGPKPSSPFHVKILHDLSS